MGNDKVTHLRGDNDPEGGGDNSLEELERERAKAAAEAEAQAEADGQYTLEIPESGKKVTLGTMIPRGTPVEVRYKMSGKSIANVKGGLMDPADTTGLLLVSFTIGDVDVKFTRDGDGKIEKATVYVVIDPKHVVNAHSEAGEVLLKGEPETAAA